MMVQLERVTLPERRVCIRRHAGGVATVDDTRRPMYQHMIMGELVGGASMLRFDEGVTDSDGLDVLIGSTCDFEGDEVVTVELLPAGDYLVWDFEGPEGNIEQARFDFAQAARAAGATGRILQVHMMDAIDGITEQQFQCRLAGSD